MYCTYPEPADYKKYVDRYASDEEIFASYGDFPMKGHFSSPFRTDRNPSCNMFRARNGKLYIVDHTTKESYDSIDLVMHMEHMGFMDALDHIIMTYILKLKPFKINEVVVKRMKRVKETIRAEIKVKPKKWTKKELRFWESCGISFETLKKFRCFPLQHLWVNDKLVYSIGETQTSTCFAYKLHPGEYQIYFPFKPKGKKFLCNTSDILGWDQLPPSGELLIISKSMKDIMVLHEMGYPAVSSIGEASVIREEIMEALVYRFKRVLVFNDFDKTGISASLYYSMHFGVESTFLTDGKAGTDNYGAKDPADLVRAHGFESAKSIIDLLIQKPIW